MVLSSCFTSGSCLLCKHLNVSLSQNIAFKKAAGSRRVFRSVGCILQAAQTKICWMPAHKIQIEPNGSSHGKSVPLLITTHRGDVQLGNFILQIFFDKLHLTGVAAELIMLFSACLYHWSSYSKGTLLSWFVKFTPRGSLFFANRWFCGTGWLFMQQLRFMSRLRTDTWRDISASNSGTWQWKWTPPPWLSPHTTCPGGWYV